jgi:hypothetical protein
VLFRKSGGAETVTYNGEAACRFTLCALYSGGFELPGADLGLVFASVGKQLDSYQLYGGNNINSTPSSSVGNGQNALWNLREFAKLYQLLPGAYEFTGGSIYPTGDGGATGNIDPVTGDVSETITFPEFTLGGALTLNSSLGMEATFEGNFYFTQLKLVLNNTSTYSLTVWGE